jgi:hypothetical protein
VTGDRLAEIKAAIQQHAVAPDLRPRELRIGALAEWLVVENERLRGLLAALEWIIGETIVVGDVAKFCPACKNAQADGHAPDCWLAAELTR